MLVDPLDDIVLTGRILFLFLQEREENERESVYVWPLVSPEG